MKTSWRGEVFNRVGRMPPFAAAIATLAGGLSLGLLSFPAGLSAVTCPSSGRQAGFLFELNWVANFMFVLPVSFYLAGLTISSIGSTIRNLAASQMLVDQEARPLSGDEAMANWHQLSSKVVPICVVLSMIAIGEGLGEWVKHSYLPIHRGTVSGLEVEYSCTWSVAAVLQPGQVRPLVNHLFAFAMYLGQGIAAAFYLSLVTVVLAFAYWVDRFNRRSDLPDLVPALGSDDKRYGFELMEPFVQNLFASALAFTAALFMVRLQFLFFGSKGGATNVYSFALNDIAAGFFRGAKVLFSGDAQLFDAGQRLVWPTAGAIAGFLVLLLISFVIVSTVLRQAAVRARDVLQRKAATRAKLYPGLTAAEQEKRLRGMAFWPLSYPGPLNLLFIMSFSVAAFIAYKLTLIVLGIIVAFGGRRLYAILGGKDDTTPAPIPPKVEGQAAAP
jgi:hypothetical protein